MGHQRLHERWQCHRQPDAGDHLNDEIGSLQAPEYDCPQHEAHDWAEPEDNHEPGQPGRPAINRYERVEQVSCDISHRADAQVQDAGHAVGQRDAAPEHREYGADH
jgi:hypothetical protein